MKVSKEPLLKAELGLVVFHEDIYNGNESMKIVGIRESTIELEGDYSGGTHAVTQRDWMPMKGAFRLRKVCEQHEKFGTCTLPNVHCGYPDCEPYVTSYPKNI